MQQPGLQSDEQGRAVSILAGLGASWAQGIELARQFAAALRREITVDLDEWVAVAVAAAPRELKRLAQSLLRDREAVANALTSFWSNGPTEGNVNRLKLIKRQM